MTEKKPAAGAPHADAVARRKAASELRRAKALKANLRRRKAPPGADPDAS